VLGATVAVLAALGGLDHAVGWIGLVAALIGFVLLAIELWLGWRSGPTVTRALDAAGLGAPDPFRGRALRLLFPIYFGDRRVRRIADVRYADGAGRRHLADVYIPRIGVENAPVLLQIHGGAWLVGNKRQQGRPLMNRMAAAGWVCVAINYRLAPRDKMPAAIFDVKLALAWIRDHIGEYGGDPDRIIVSGGSAGGHLAVMAALTINDPEYQPGFESTDTSVLACVPLYPPTDLLAIFDFGSRWTRRMTERTTPWVFGVSPTADPARYRHWSPITLVRPGLVPFLVVQGTGDNLVPCEQTRAFVERLRAQPDQQVLYLELPGAPHAFEVFHSLRAEAAASAVHRFCSAIIADAAIRASTAGRSTASDPGSAEGSDRIDVEAR
jgi:acetyl esterase/lipase